MTDVSDIHPMKALAPILVYEEGIITTGEEHPKYAAYDVTDDGIAVLGTWVFWKALPPILVTLVGIVTDVNDEQYEKAL